MYIVVTVVIFEQRKIANLRYQETCCYTVKLFNPKRI